MGWHQTRGVWAHLAACVLATCGLHGSTAQKVGRPDKVRTGVAVETPTPIQSYHMGKRDHGPAFHPYDSSAIPSVVTLDHGIFEALVQDNSSATSVWFVDFFQYTSDPKFRHTPDVVQGFKAAAKVMDGVVKFGVFDIGKIPSAQRRSYPAYPATLFYSKRNFWKGSTAASKWKGGRSLPELVARSLDEKTKAIQAAAESGDAGAAEKVARLAEKTVEIEASLKAAQATLTEQGFCVGAGVDEDICDDKKQADRAPLDVEYDPANFEWDARRFETQVLGQDRLVLVFWFAPWCKVCKAFAPVWDVAIERFRGYKFYKIDATIESSAAHWADDHGVDMFPTIKLFRVGAKEISDGIRYKRPDGAEGAEGDTISTIGSFIGKWSGFGGRAKQEEEAAPEDDGYVDLDEAADPDLDDIGFHPQHMQDTAKLAAQKQRDKKRAAAAGGGKQEL